jgi:glycogen synthase
MPNKNSHLEKIIKQKKSSKDKLIKNFKLPGKGKKPVIGIILDSEPTKTQQKLLNNVLEAANELPCTVILLADADYKMPKKSRAFLLSYGRDMRKQLIEAADMAICFNFNDVEEMFLHGTVPIVSDKTFEGGKNYNPNKETGNCFTFTNENHWQIFAALIRALETYKFPYDWKHIVREGLEAVSL